MSYRVCALFLTLQPSNPLTLPTLDTQNYACKTCNPGH